MCMNAEFNLKVVSLITSFEAVLSDLYGKPIQLVINPGEHQVKEETIREIVCKFFDLDWHNIIKPLRTKRLTTARQLYCYLCRRYVKYLTLQQIGYNINRDHTTVINAVQVVTDYLEIGDEYMVSSIREIERQIQKIYSPINQLTNETETNTAAAAGLAAGAN